MSNTPGGKIKLQVTVTAPNVFDGPDEVEIPSGFDLCGGVVVSDNTTVGGDTISAFLELNFADSTDAPAPAWVAALDGTVTAIATDTSNALGDARQLMRIGHARRLRLRCTGTGAGVTAGTIAVYLSSIAPTTPSIGN